MPKKEREQDKERLLEGFLELRGTRVPLLGVATADRPRFRRMRELLESITKRLDEHPGEELLLAHEDAEVLRRALADALELPAFRLEVGERREREARARAALRGELDDEKKLSRARQAEALRILGLRPEDGKTGKRAPAHLILWCYHRLTTETGTVWVRDDVSWALEDANRTELVQGCPLEAADAILVVARVFGFETARLCQSCLIRWRALVEELRQEHAGQPHVLAALPQLAKLPHTWPQGSHSPYEE